MIFAPEASGAFFLQKKILRLTLCRRIFYTTQVIIFLFSQVSDCMQSKQHHHSRPA